MDVKITFYRMLIFSVVVTALLTASIFTMPAATITTTTYAQTLTGGGEGDDNTGTITAPSTTTPATPTPPEGTSPLTLTLRMGESGGGITSTTIPPGTDTSTAPLSSPTTTTPSSLTTSDSTTRATATTASTATGSNNLSTRNIGIEVTVVRGNEATVILPINTTIPANVNNLDLCASSMGAGAVEMCQPVLRTIDLTQNGAATATDTTASGTTTSSSSPSPFSSPPPSSSSSAPTTTAPTTSSSSFPPATTTGGNSLIGGIEDTTVNIPITIIAPITAQIQNARLCAQLPSGTQSCNQIILNPEQTAYAPVNVDMTTSPAAPTVTSSQFTDTTAATETTITGTTDTAGRTTSSSSTTTTTTTPTTPSTTTTTSPPSSTNNNNTTNTTGGGATTSSSPPPPLGDTSMAFPPGATTSSDGTIRTFLYANPATFEGYCPPTIGFIGGIGDKLGNRDIRYRFIASNGDTTPEQVIHLDEPGGHRVGINTLIEPPVNWVAIEILQPVQLQSNRAEVQITCTPDTTTSGGDGTITATLSANPATYEGPCPVNIDFTGTITDSVGNRDIRYRTIDSRGFTGAEETIRLSQGESETIFPLSASIGGTARPGEGTQGWVAIEFLEPNRFVAGRAMFDIICTALSTGGAPPPPAAGTDTIAPSLSVPVTRVIPTTSPTGQELVLYDVSATDNVDGTARLGANNMVTQEDNFAGSVTISCNPPSNTNFRLGNHTVQCSATDAAGNVGTASFIISVTSPTTSTPPGGFSSGTITAYLSANPATYNGPCPATIEFSGTITDYVGNRDVIYRFIFSDGSVQDNVLHFNQPGSQSVSTTRPLGDDLGESQAWGAIQVLQPNYLQSNRAEIEITCTPSTGGALPQTLQAENTTTATDGEDTPPITDEGEAGDGAGDDGTDSGTPAPPATTDEGGEDDGEGGGEGETEPPPATTEEGGGEGDGTEDGGDEPPAPATDE